MAAFTDEEEQLFGTAEGAPWLLATRLRERGAAHESGPPTRRSRSSTATWSRGRTRPALRHPVLPVDPVGPARPRRRGLLGRVRDRRRRGGRGRPVGGEPALRRRRPPRRARARAPRPRARRRAAQLGADPPGLRRAGRAARRRRGRAAGTDHRAGARDRRDGAGAGPVRRARGPSDPAVVVATGAAGRRARRARGTRHRGQAARARLTSAAGDRPGTGGGRRRCAHGARRRQRGVEQRGLHRGVDAGVGAVRAVPDTLAGQQDRPVQGVDRPLRPAVGGDRVEPAADHQRRRGARAGQRCGDPVGVRGGPHRAGQRAVGGAGADPRCVLDRPLGGRGVRGDVGRGVPVRAAHRGVLLLRRGRDTERRDRQVAVEQVGEGAVALLRGRQRGRQHRPEGAVARRAAGGLQQHGAVDDAGRGEALHRPGRGGAAFQTGDERVERGGRVAVAERADRGTFRTAGVEPGVEGPLARDGDLVEELQGVPGPQRGVDGRVEDHLPDPVREQGGVHRADDGAVGDAVVGDRLLAERGAEPVQVAGDVVGGQTRQERRGPVHRAALGQRPRLGEQGRQRCAAGDRGVGGGARGGRGALGVGAAAHRRRGADAAWVHRDDVEARQHLRPERARRPRGGGHRAQRVGRGDPGAARVEEQGADPALGIGGTVPHHREGDPGAVGVGVLLGDLEGAALQAGTARAPGDRVGWRDRGAWAVRRVRRRRSRSGTGRRRPRGRRAAGGVGAGRACGGVWGGRPAARIRPGESSARPGSPRRHDRCRGVPAVGRRRPGGRGDGPDRAAHGPVAGGVVAGRTRAAAGRRRRGGDAGLRRALVAAPVPAAGGRGRGRAVHVLRGRVRPGAGRAVRGRRPLPGPGLGRGVPGQLRVVRGVLLLAARAGGPAVAAGRGAGGGTCGGVRLGAARAQPPAAGRVAARAGRDGRVRRGAAGRAHRARGAGGTGPGDARRARAPVVAAQRARGGAGVPPRRAGGGDRAGRRGRAGERPPRPAGPAGGHRGAPGTGGGAAAARDHRRRGAARGDPPDRDRGRPARRARRHHRGAPGARDRGAHRLPAGAGGPHQRAHVRAGCPGHGDGDRRGRGRARRRGGEPGTGPARPRRPAGGRAGAAGAGRAGDARRGPAGPRPDPGRRVADRDAATVAVVTASDPVAVLIVDDDPVVRFGLSMMLRGADGLTVVAEAGDGAEGVALAERHRPDVVLMDIRMPGTDGLTATETLRRRPGAPQVVVLTTFDADAHVLRALRAGAAGFLLKDTPPDELVLAVRHAAAGRPVLSPEVTRRLIDRVAETDRDSTRAAARRRLERLAERERTIALDLGAGRSNAEIAARHHISVATVKTHVSAILAKLDLNNRVQVALLLVEAGAQPPELGEEFGPGGRVGGARPGGVGLVVPGGLRTGPLDLLGEPAGDGRGHGAQHGDPGDHQAGRDQPALGRHRVAVAVADGRDRGQDPPQGVGEGRDRCVGHVAFGLVDAERRDEPQQRHGDDEVGADPAAEVVPQRPGQHRHRADEPDQAQEPQERGEQDQDVEGVVEQEPPPVAGQPQPDRDVGDEHRPQHPQEGLQGPPRRGPGAGQQHLAGVEQQEPGGEHRQTDVGPCFPRPQARFRSGRGTRHGRRLRGRDTAGRPEPERRVRPLAGRAGGEPVQDVVDLPPGDLRRHGVVAERGQDGHAERGVAAADGVGDGRGPPGRAAQVPDPGHDHRPGAGDDPVEAVAVEPVDQHVVAEVGVRELRLGVHPGRRARVQRGDGVVVPGDGGAQRREQCVGPAGSAGADDPDPQDATSAQVDGQERQVRVGDDGHPGGDVVGQGRGPVRPGVQRGRVAGGVRVTEDAHEPAADQAVGAEQPDDDRGDDVAGVGTRAAQPGEVARVRRRGHPDGAAGAGELDGVDVVGGPAVGADGEAEPAAGQVPDDADRRCTAVRRAQAVRRGRGDDVAPGRAGPGAGGACDRVDRHLRHRRGVDQQAAVARTAQAVPGGVYGDGEAVAAGPGQRGDDVVRAGDGHDGRGAVEVEEMDRLPVSIAAYGTATPALPGRGRRLRDRHRGRRGAARRATRGERAAAAAGTRTRRTPGRTRPARGHPHRGRAGGAAARPRRPRRRGGRPRRRRRAARAAARPGRGRHGHLAARHRARRPGRGLRRRTPAAGGDAAGGDHRRAGRRAAGRAARRRRAGVPARPARRSRRTGAGRVPPGRGGRGGRPVRRTGRGDPGRARGPGADLPAPRARPARRAGRGAGGPVAHRPGGVRVRRDDAAAAPGRARGGGGGGPGTGARRGRGGGPGPAAGRGADHPGDPDAAAPGLALGRARRTGGAGAAGVPAPVTPGAGISGGPTPGPARPRRPRHAARPAPRWRSGAARRNGRRPPTPTARRRARRRRRRTGSRPPRRPAAARAAPARASRRATAPAGGGAARPRSPRARRAGAGPRPGRSAPRRRPVPGRAAPVRPRSAPRTRGPAGVGDGVRGPADHPVGDR
ncbi:hypothetical protein L7F22_025604 [Adiantum nelumboides]|nr:hypothetical protein [Adiantum nelumboides]